MATANSTCPQCSAQLAPAEWSVHQQNFHSGQENWLCPDCAFSSAHFPCCLAHALLEGHACLRSKRGTKPLTPSTEAKSPGEVESRSEDCAVEVLGTNVEPTENANDYTALAPQEDKPTESRLPPERASSEAVKSEFLNESWTEVNANLQDNAFEISEELPRPVSENKTTLVCNKCEAVLTAPYAELLRRAKMHVRSCCNIKEFACSDCGYLTAAKKTTRHHIKNTCPDAVVISLEQERCAAAEKDCMSVCFPSVQYYRKHSGENTHKLECANCLSIYRYSSDRVKRGIIGFHVRKCLKILPFSCSNCEYMAERKNVVQKHIESHCNAATVELLHKDRDEQAVKDGVLVCFPNEAETLTSFQLHI